MPENNFRERRTYGNLRALVDLASPLPRATIRWGARRLEPDKLAELDSRIARREAEPPNSSAPGGRERLREVFNSATPEERDAIRYIVGKMGPTQVAELEELVGRNARALNSSRGESKAGPGL
jgi:hypothetical protein